MRILATVISDLTLQNALEKQGIYTRVQSAIPMTSISEPFIRRRSTRYMQKRRVVIFAVGIGNPFFTTDSAAVLRAVKMKCDYIFKGTNVDRVCNKDPNQNKGTTKHHEITYTDVLRDNLKIMDYGRPLPLLERITYQLKLFSLKQKSNFARV